MATKGAKEESAGEHEDEPSELKTVAAGLLLANSKVELVLKDLATVRSSLEEVVRSKTEEVISSIDGAIMSLHDVIQRLDLLLKAVEKQGELLWKHTDTLENVERTLQEIKDTQNAIKGMQAEHEKQFDEIANQMKLLESKLDAGISDIKSEISKNKEIQTSILNVLKWIFKKLSP